MILHRNPDGTNGARPKHGALARREYGLLAPEEPAGDPAAVELQECGDGHEATMGTGLPDVKETDTGYQTRQRKLLA